MTAFTVRFKFAGQNGEVVTRSMRTINYAGADVGADLLSAVAAADAAVTAWEAVTDAGVIGYNINYEVANADPAGGDLQNTGQLNVYTADLLPNGQHNTFPLNIPAISDAMMVGVSGESFDQVDVGDAAIQALIDAIETDFTFSDGETIDNTQGTGGIRNGYRVKKAKNYST